MLIRAPWGHQSMSRVRGSNIYRVTSPAIHNNKDFLKTRPMDVSLKRIYIPLLPIALCLPYRSYYSCHIEYVHCIVKCPLLVSMPSIIPFNVGSSSLGKKAKVVPRMPQRGSQIKFTTMAFYWFKYGDTSYEMNWNKIWWLILQLVISKKGKQDNLNKYFFWKYQPRKVSMRPPGHTFAPISDNALLLVRQ